MHRLNQHPSFLALQADYQSLKNTHIRDLFEKNPQRAQLFSLHLDGLYFDFSNQRLTDNTLTHFEKMANALSLSEPISQLLNGGIVNLSENKPALHTALRDFSAHDITVNGKPIRAEIEKTRDQLASFSEDIRSGILKSASGEAYTDVVNLGIGGSDLGPKLIYDALKQTSDALRCHFVSSIDPHALHSVLQTLNPNTTLFIIASKSFTTLETLSNAKRARTWLSQTLGEHKALQHFLAVTAAPEKAKTFGIAEKNIFPFWDWVGGRFSIWSAIALPVIIACGFSKFVDFLKGAEIVDQHFKTAPFKKNIPILLACTHLWLEQFFGKSARAMIPYSTQLKYLPDYLQQAEMESLGKSVSPQGEYLMHPTGGIVFGQEGCHGQHAYHQWLHQGQAGIGTDFILITKPNRSEETDAHQTLLASALAQIQALLMGENATQIRSRYQTQGIQLSEQEIAQRTLPGNRPANVIALSQLDAKHLGMLLAVYEHCIFVKSIFYGINAFDQWGVELGKRLLPEMESLLRQTNSEIPANLSGMLNFLRN